METENDYIIEFYKEIDVFVESVASVIVKNLVCTPYGIEDFLANSLRFVFYKQRDAYIKSRRSGIGIRDSLQKLAVPFFKNDFLEKIRNLHRAPSKQNISDISGTTSSYIFYCNGRRMLEAISPLLKMIGAESILFWDSDGLVNLDELSPTIEIVQAPKEVLQPIHSLFDCVERVLNYQNLFEMVLDRMKPKAIIGMDGCQTHLKILSHVANERSMPSICLQHGWPSFFHGAFRNLPYSHFFTWGRKFDELWSHFNPMPTYVSCGYPYNIQYGGPHDAITFFLQAPLYLATPDIFSRFYSLALKCAKRFNHCRILIRSHPEYPLPVALKKYAESFDNIRLVDDWPIEVVYAQTFVVVSHFSSCTMEGLLHGCYPLVFDPVYASRYYPCLEYEGLGFMAKTESKFMEILERVIMNQCSSVASLANWCEAAGCDAVKNMIKYIQQML